MYFVNSHHWWVCGFIKNKKLKLYIRCCCCRQRCVWGCGKIGNSSTRQPANRRAIKTQCRRYFNGTPAVLAAQTSKSTFIWSVFHTFSHTKNSPLKQKLIMHDLFHLQESCCRWLETFPVCRLLYVCLCGGRSWCSVCVSACPLPSRASPLPEPQAQPGLSGVIPWKGMTEPQCLEMAALAAISSSKKRAH